MLICIVLLSACTAPVKLPELADVVFSDDFEHGLSPAWRPYDNWSKPFFEVTDQSPIGHGRALRIEFDDKTTLHHYDKGAVVTLPSPIPWQHIDFISARYWVDKKVGNIRIFCHCDKGGWWDYTQRDVAIGKPAVVTASRSDFRLAWTDNPSAPPPDKTGRVLQIFFSVHNPGAINQGARRVLYIDDVTVGTWLLPLRQPLDVNAPPLHCWAWARGKIGPQQASSGSPSLSEIAHWAAIPCGDSVVWAAVDGRSLWLIGIAAKQAHLVVNGTPVDAVWRNIGGKHWFIACLPAPKAPHGPITLQCGDKQWQGRYIMARRLTAAEALGLSFRTKAARLTSTRDIFYATQPLTLRLDLPLPWARSRVTGEIPSQFGARISFAISETQAHWWGTSMELSAHKALPVLLGSRRAEVTILMGDQPLRLRCQVHIEEVDRRALSAASAAAEAAAQKLSQRVQAGRRENWWARKPPAVHLKIPDRTRVDPAKWSQLPDPVTWQDLGGGFVGGAQCGIDERSIKTFFDHYDFGRVIKPHLGYLLRDDWRQNIERVAHRGLIVTSVWGYVPDIPWNGGFGEVKIPRHEHEEIMRLLGRRFLGYEMGEQDGRYIGAYAPRYHPTTRTEAKRLFYQWHQRIIDNFFGRMVALASLNFQHDYARLGLRMLGIEASQALPSDTMQWAFIRGACKQYGLLGWNCISIYNRWGYKSYTSTGKDHGPDKGPSLSLLRRLWYVTYMYGSAINMFEGAYFLPEKDAQGFPRLSPVGKIHCDAVQWARQHANRGVPYTPVAIMLHRDAGWVPPRHLYTAKRYLSWGNLPYSRADHATDAIFRLIWPGYQDCSYYKDERGYLTPTPYGDMFDVILDDAPDQCLRRYQTVILISETGIGDDASIKRLRRFVHQGGELIIDPIAARQLGPDITGIEITSRRQTAQRSVLLPSGEVLTEEPYSYLVARPTGAQALALSEHGDGIIWHHQAGRGRVIVCCAQSFVAARTQDPQKGVDVPLRHKLLCAFTRVLDRHLKGLALLRLRGDVEQIGYLCNVTEDPGHLILTLVNNGQSQARIHVTAQPGKKITAADWWLGSGQLREGTIEVHLPPGELAIVHARIAQ